jgi:hypothetical protein
VDASNRVGIGTTNPTLGPLQMGSGAYVTVGGVWTNASSRSYKDEIAEDVPDLVATKDRKGVSAVDIVAVLTKVVQKIRRSLSGRRLSFWRASRG